MLGVRGCLLLTSIVGLSLVAPLGAGHAADQTPANAIAEMNEKIAQLAGKPRTGPTPVETGLEVRKAIDKGKFAAARKKLAEVLAASTQRSWRFYPFSVVIHGIPDVHNPEQEKRLNEWVAQAPDDPLPLLTRAMYYHDMAWAKRGENFASKTSAGRIISFEDYMTNGLADISNAIRLDQSNPYSYTILLYILSSQGMTVELAKAFTDALAKHPDNFTLYKTTLSALQPKWGGSVAAMYEFVNAYAGKAPADSPPKMLNLFLYYHLLGDAVLSCRDHPRESDERVRCIAAYMDKNLTPDLQQHLREAFQLYDRLDPVEFGLIVREVVSAMLPAPGGQAYSRPVLEQAAAAMHGSTDMVGLQPRPNNYIVDELVAEMRRSTFALDLGIKALDQAVRDIESVKFADDQVKSQELSYLYEMLATYYDLKQDPVNTIVYETAALKLSGVVEHEDLICRHYLRLKLYDEAIRSCSEAVDRDDNINARYWRGVAYREMNQLDASLADLTVVADSDSDQRIYAAMGMAADYVFKNDFQGALQVYDKYTFMFDLNVANHDFVAVAYDNRCLAYEKVGELQKALDACNAALKYAFLPDAYQRQQELMQRLGKH